MREIVCVAVVLCTSFVVNALSQLYKIVNLRSELLCLESHQDYFASLLFFSFVLFKNKILSATHDIHTAVWYVVRIVCGI